jgi:hypothetical protein
VIYLKCASIGQIASPFGGAEVSNLHSGEPRKGDQISSARSKCRPAAGSRQG